MLLRNVTFFLTSRTFCIFKENLTKQIQSLGNEKQDTIEKNRIKVEELHALLKETKLSLASENEKLKTLDTEKTDLANMLSELMKEKSRVEQELQEKVN